ncbi:hypothetical protein B0H66DRAFT_566617 [Apodospora peruviana]|uniref:Uncharacterized protein n=1 Tax=Apodospora peruviana TaxID=516989 RepID=A0AAE0LZP9_9PEZI|nr:hypothetical protein B0H66DRAFT_566617 [Apodospora peruviana]
MILLTLIIFIALLTTQTNLPQPSIPTTMDPTVTTTTHDTSAAAYHIPTFSHLVSQLNDAVEATWPERPSATYTRVKVLLMSWEKDDLGVESETQALSSIFQGLYNYDVESWKIPSRRPAIELSRKIADLIDTYGREGNLLIFYYGGHARPNEQAGGSPVWVANRSRSSPSVQSSIVHSLLAEIDCDVLFLPDCCHAIQAGEASTGKGVIETLAACGFESITPEVGRHSFTTSLVQELAYAAHTKEWPSVVELHRRLINRLQTWQPSVYFTDNTRSVVHLDANTGQPVFELPRRRTPIYCFLSKKPRTIVLSPLPAPVSSEPGEPFVFLNPLQQQAKEKDPIGPEILVTCRLRDHRLNVDQWKEWLLRAPPGAQGIRITDIYPSFSTLLLLRLPLVVWDMLPSSPAISFVGYVTGKSHLPDFKRRLGPALDTFSMQEDTVQEKNPSAAGDVESSPGRLSTVARPRKDPGVCQTGQHLWPESFDSPHKRVYMMEDQSYCLDLSEYQYDTRTSKSEKIIKAFTGDVGDPSKMYICEEINSFCSTASFELLLEQQEQTFSMPSTIVDDRWLDVDSTSSGRARILGPQNLYDVLSKKSERPESLTQTDAEDEYSPVRRRLIHITNPDAMSLLAIVSTASQNQAFALRDFVYKYITFQPGMDVRIQSSRSLSFELSFHLPFFAWRSGAGDSVDTRPGTDMRPLRSRKDLSFLEKPAGRHNTFVYEAQISCVVTGIADRFWTAYGFFDTYHDGGNNVKHDVHLYEPTEGEPDMDPLTGGRHASDTPIWTARDYFLRVLESSVSEVKDEWHNTVLNLTKKIKPFTRNVKGTNRKTVWRDSPQIVQLLDELLQGLSATVTTWERFQESDLSYFELEDDPASSGTGLRAALMVKNIENDIRELRILGEFLSRQTDILKSFTATFLTLDNNKNGEKTNVLVTTGLAFLPFALMALISNVPEIIVVKPNPTRYLTGSAGMAGLTTALFLAMLNWNAATERSEDIFAYLWRLIQWPRALAPGGDVSGGRIGNVWPKRRSRGRGSHYSPLSGVDGDEENRMGESAALPFYDRD